LIYQKVYTRDTWWLREHFIFSGSNYFTSNNLITPRVLLGGIRQDTSLRKVYFNSFFPDSYEYMNCVVDPLPLGQDLILFDFDANVGDTIYLHLNEFIINNIDIIQLNDGVNRREFYLYHPFAGPLTLIEGIGSRAGLFAGIRSYDFVEGFECTLRQRIKNN